MDNQQDPVTVNPADDSGSKYHKTLARQIRKYLSNNGEAYPEFAEFLRAISDTYTHADEDRALIERSLDISSKELTENYLRVKQQVDARTSELRQRTEEAEDNRRMLQAILDNLPVGVFVVKAPGGESVMMNRAGAIIAGHNPEGATDASNYNIAFDILKEDGTLYPNEELPLHKTLQTGKTFGADDMWIRRPNGSVVAVRAFTAPILHADGKFSNAVSVFEDISAERNLEHTRDEFFAIASHELRTPLTAIRGNSSMIMSYYSEAMKDPSLSDMIQDIHQSSIRLINIVNDFLDMSRLEQKRMKYEFSSFDAVEVADSVAKEYDNAGRAQDVSLTVEHPESALPPIHADKDRLKQVLINLVGNALKFTDRGSVNIHFSNEGDHLKILVSDTGPGMTEEAKKMLFHKFEQTGMDPLTRDSVRGTGLGLYISKLLILDMSGDIYLESSELGQGTVFAVTIPYTKSNQ